MKNSQQKVPVTLRTIRGTLQLRAGDRGDWRTTPDHVSVTLENPNVDRPTPRQKARLKGRVFLGISLGRKDCYGEADFTELDGVIRPDQIDRLIHVLTVAKQRAEKEGMIAPTAKGRRQRNSGLLSGGNKA